MHSCYHSRTRGEFGSSILSTIQRLERIRLCVDPTGEEDKSTDSVRG